MGNKQGDVKQPVADGSAEVVRARRSRVRVLLAVKDLALQEEILDFLDRDPRLDVVGATSEPDRLARLVADMAPDATVVCPLLSRLVRHPATIGRAGAILVVTEEMNVPLLRESIEVGARGVFEWPEERGQLAQNIAVIPSEQAIGGGRGRVIAVYGVRGGAGATFVATHLAAALADRGRRCALVDLDVVFAGVTVALGIRAEEASRTITDLAPVVDELTQEHVEDALYPHPRGFSVLLGPEEASSIPSELFRRSIGLLAGSFDMIVLHLPRVLDQAARTCVRMSDRMLLVATLDLFSLYGARRAMAPLGLREPGTWCRLVINRLGRAAITPKEVQRVLGVGDWSGVRIDTAVARAQDRGELLSTRARRAGADIRALARLLDDDSGTGVGRPAEEA